MEKMKEFLDRSEHCTSYLLFKHGELHPFGTGNKGFQEIYMYKHIPIVLRIGMMENKMV